MFSQVFVILSLKGGGGGWWHEMHHGIGHMVWWGEVTLLTGTSTPPPPPRPGPSHPTRTTTPTAWQRPPPPTPWPGSPPLPLPDQDHHAPPQEIENKSIRSMCGQYASYWNAFLLLLIFQSTYSQITSNTKVAYLSTSYFLYLKSQ